MKTFDEVRRTDITVNKMLQMPNVTYEDVIVALVKDKENLMKLVTDFSNIAFPGTEEPPRMGVGPTASQYVDSTTGQRLKKSEEGENAVLNGVIQRSLYHADRILLEADWEIETNDAPYAAQEKIKEALAVIRGISKTIES